MSGPDSCPTVRIVVPGHNGPAIINECDFDKSKHKLFVDKPKTAEELKAEEAAASAALKLAAEEAEKNAPRDAAKSDPKPAGWGAAPPAA